MAPAGNTAPAEPHADALTGRRDTSCLTSRLLLTYVEQAGGRRAVDELLERCGLADKEELLRDENAWFSWKTKVLLFEQAAEVLDDPFVARHVGETAIELSAGQALKLTLRALGSPGLIYGNTPRVNAKFVLTHRMEVEEIGPNHARLTNTTLLGAHHHPADCEYNIGLLTCVPALFGLPRARVRHATCMGSGAPACVYEVSWSERDHRRVLGVGAGAGLAAVAGSALLAPALLPLVGGGAAVLAVVGLRRLRGVELERYRLLKAETEQEADVAELLTGSLQDLVSNLRIDEVLEKITANARAAVGGTEFTLLLAERDEMRCQGSSGLSDESVEALERWAVGAAGLLKAPLMVDDTAEVDKLASLAEADPPLRSLCAAPLVFRGRPLGILVSLAASVKGFMPRDVELMRLYATQAAIALTNARLYEAQEERASRDSLTGLLNHGEFHESVLRELDRCRRYGGQFSVALLDLDDFKRINDMAGHLEGDRVLRAVAEQLLGACRASDTAFRIGGDEFALVLPSTDVDGAGEVVAHIGEAIRRVEPRTGLSYGIATWPDHGPSKELLIAHADSALYEMKRAAADTSTVWSVNDASPESSDDRIPPASSKAARYRQLAVASRLSAKLPPLLDPAEVATVSVNELQRSFGYVLASVHRLDEGDVLYPLALGGEMSITARPESIPAATLSLSRGVIGRVARTGEPALVPDTSREPDFVAPPGSLTSGSELAVPIRVAGELWGVLNVEHLGRGAFSVEDLVFADTIAAQIGAAVHRIMLFGELEGAFMTTLGVLSDALERKDLYTAQHAHEVAELSERVGIRLGIFGEELRTLRYGALLHDIGKIGVRSEVLNKPDRLDEAEFEEIKQHTLIGARMLERIPFFASVHPLVRSAHERWDGAGYPDGLVGPAIPLGARIICACDAFHAMTSDRPYQAAIPVPAAIHELRDNAGTQFDPEVVETLVAELTSDAVASRDSWTSRSQTSNGTSSRPSATSVPVSAAPRSSASA